MVERLETLKGDTATGAPVFHELIYGVHRLPPSRRRSVIERFIEEFIRPSIEILPYDTAAAEWHGAERARLVGIGRTPPHFDGQIASIAATNGLILVTFNLADFQHFRGLQVEDWRS